MITVKEFLELQTNCYVRVNGDDISRDNHDYDDYIVTGVSVEAYFSGHISTDRSDDLDCPEFYLYVNAEEPESNE